MPRFGKIPWRARCLQRQFPFVDLRGTALVRIATFSFVSVIFLHTDQIGTWTQWQMVLLVGASNFIQQIFQAFFLVNCTNLSELVRTGKIDFLLLLPVNTRFIVSLRQVDLGAFVNATFAVGVMALRGAKLRILPQRARKSRVFCCCASWGF